MERGVKMTIREMAKQKIEWIIHREGDLDGFRRTKEYLNMIEDEITNEISYSELTMGARYDELQSLRIQ